MQIFPAQLTKRLMNPPNVQTVSSIQLGNGETGTDVRVRNNRLHCQNCYSNDEGNIMTKVIHIAGFSQ